MTQSVQLSHLGRKTNVDKLVLIQKTSQGAKCRDCVDDDDTCVDPISKKGLEFPAFKNIKPSDQRCYNQSSIQKLVNGSASKLPQDPNSAPGDPTFWLLPPDIGDAGRFDMSDIYSAYGGDTGTRNDSEVARALFAATFRYADSFSMADIVKLADMRMPAEAEQLFTRTLPFYPPVGENGPLGNKLAVERIRALCHDAKLPQLGPALYTKHKWECGSEGLPLKFPLNEIIELHDIGLEVQSLDLFWCTVVLRNNSVAKDLEFVHALHQAGLIEQAAGMYALVHRDHAHAVTPAGCRTLQNERALERIENVCDSVRAVRDMLGGRLAEPQTSETFEGGE